MIARLLVAWRAVAAPTRYLAYALTALFVLAFGGELVRWYGGGDAAPGRTAATRRPQRLAPTKAAEKMAIAEKPAAVVVKAPTRKQAEKLEQRFTLGLEAAGAGDAQLVNVWHIPKAPAGGEVAVTVSPTGQASATFVEEPLPFFAWGGDWEAGAGAVVDVGGGYGVRLHAGKDLLRAGRMVLKVEADLDAVRGETQGRAAVLGVIRF